MIHFFRIKFSYNSETSKPNIIKPAPKYPKLVIFSPNIKKANIAAKIGSNEKIIPALAGVTFFWYLVCKAVVISVANIDVYKIAVIKLLLNSTFIGSISVKENRKRNIIERIAVVTICRNSKTQKSNFTVFISKNIMYSAKKNAHISVSPSPRLKFEPISLNKFIIEDPPLDKKLMPIKTIIVPIILKK